MCPEEATAETGFSLSGGGAGHLSSGVTVSVHSYQAVVLLFSRSTYCRRFNLCLGLSRKGHSSQKVLIKAAKPTK